MEKAMKDKQRAEPPKKEGHEGEERKEKEHPPTFFTFFPSIADTFQNLRNFACLRPGRTDNTTETTGGTSSRRAFEVGADQRNRESIPLRLLLLHLHAKKQGK